MFLDVSISLTNPDFKSRASPVCSEGISAAPTAQLSHTQKTRNHLWHQISTLPTQNCSISYQPSPTPFLEFSYCSCHSSERQKPVPLVSAICPHTLLEHSKFCVGLPYSPLSVILLPGLVALHIFSPLWLESLPPTYCPDSFTIFRLLRPHYHPTRNLESCSTGSNAPHLLVPFFYTFILCDITTVWNFSCIYSTLWLLLQCSASSPGADF